MRVTRSKAPYDSEQIIEKMCRTKTIQHYAQDHQDAQNLYRDISALNTLNDKAEELFGKELHLLEEDQFKEVMEDSCQLNARSTQTVLSMLRRYISWCERVNILPSRYEGFAAYKKHPALTLEADKINYLPALEKYALRNVDECYWFLDVSCEVKSGTPVVPATIFCWAGVPSREVAKVLEDEVDTYSGVIRHNGRTLQVPDVLLGLLREYANIDYIERRFKTNMKFVAEPSKYFIKRFAFETTHFDRPASTDMMSNAFSRANAIYQGALGRGKEDHKMFGQNVFLSGRLREAGERYLQNGPLSREELTEIFWEKRLISPQTGDTLNKIIQDYIEFSGMGGA